MAADGETSTENTPIAVRPALPALRVYEQGIHLMERCSSPSLGHGAQRQPIASFVSEVPSSAFQTPLSSCSNGAILTGIPEAVSAELLLTAQQKLQEVYPSGTVPPPCMVNGPSTEQQVIFPKMNSLDATMDNCDFSRKLEPQPVSHQPSPNASDQHGGCEGMGESDEESVSSMNDGVSRKRKRADWTSPCTRAKEVAATEQHYCRMCHDLAAQNALLKGQLAAVVKAMHCERASAQAELQALRQKNAALGAFLPQSVAAFAGEVPSSLLTKKGLRAMSSWPRAPHQPLKPLPEQALQRCTAPQTLAPLPAPCFSPRDREAAMQDGRPSCPKS